MKPKTGLKFLWLSLAVLVMDLFSKYIVVQRFELYESINVMPMFNLTYARNYGAAFSFLADHSGWQKYFFLGLAVIISVALIVMLFKNKAELKLQNSAYALIIGGAIGNAIDRAYHGYVVDFFDFYWDIYHYPVFNVADIGIVIGAGLLILESLLDSRKKKNNK
ncbi:Lipoprotein signal peptidase [Bibersteinia trehalosi USDA-ARS-USMARC-189]|uniref:Lipoprotein signal peptidase n=1 Tax=Bibersteinia trehalosi USDA-ARS-USMARC-189 TaxID=1263831 RepID=A0ABM7D4Z4_BIBTR|nr:signal peptidase II [Bibersteinia trehalosi]AGH37476.1 Lipoprotein signal peptidase [Bibersteinia trehalosi USDA-ARS-USMARC-192]AHG85050.1 Lipoprotein signal peptidase [Bibersteinia trehalosi USDA-ARS-USMARC-189]